MTARAVLAVISLLLFASGCAHMAEMEAKRSSDFRQSVSRMDDWQLESLHRDIRQKMDRLQSTVTFITSSPFGLGVADSQLRELQQQRVVVESEMERRGKMVPGKAYSGEEFFRRLK